MRFDVVVVGGGVMGSSTAYALAGRGHSVALVERFAPGHARGSSHGASRIFRLSYRDERYVAMAQEALGLWRDIESAAGIPLVMITGGIDAGAGLELNVAALERHGVAYEMLDGAEVSQRWPYLAFSPGEPVLFQRDAGFVHAERAWRAFTAGAASRGARLFDGTRVDRLEQSEDGVTVVAGERSFEAATVVVTAGAWARTLLDTAGIPLDTRPTRETIAYFKVDAEVPLPFVDWGSPSMYSLPDPARGMKAGGHHAGPTADPDEVGGPDPEVLGILVEWVRRRYPGADHVPLDPETCFYTNTPDEHFVLERHGRIVVGSPCSGHGFKFAPLIGRRLADLALA